MNSDIRVLTTFPRHPKTIKLKRLIGTWEPIIVLWLWAGESRPSGSLSGMSPDDIAIACMWDGNAEELILALLKVGFLHKQKSDGAYVLHGWGEHNAYAANAERRSEKARLAAQARWERRLRVCSNDAKDKVEHKEKMPVARAPSPNPSPSPNPIPSPSKEIYSLVCSHLNEVANKKYKHTSKKTRRLIDARINEGFKADDFFNVINNQCQKWLNDPKMDQYLRPETLFGTKFESYLNNTPNKMEGVVSDVTIHNLKVLEEWDREKPENV